MRSSDHKLTLFTRLAFAVAVAFLILTQAVGVHAQKTPAEREAFEMFAQWKADRYAGVYQAVVEQTLNQTLYDVKDYHIDIEVNPSTSTIEGSVTVTAEVVSAMLDTMELNLLNSGMTVILVWNMLAPLSFTHVDDILTIELDRTYTSGELVSFVVEYSGTPDVSYDAFEFHTHDGKPMIWSLSEPFGARCWWPCKDVPSDKADSVTIEVTVPDTLIVASNGTLDDVTLGADVKTYTWTERYPITTYLVSVAIHPYEEFSHWYHYAPDDSMEVKYYVFEDNLAAAMVDYQVTVPQIEAFADMFGPYPFINEKYGHADFTAIAGGMEHQTMTSLGGNWEWLIAHELAHQWWGNYITCDDFHHIWVNEGFARYAESLWYEYTYGEATYWSDILSKKYYGAGTIYVPDVSDVNRIFHTGLSYNKGSWVLHMLRHVVGDTTFFDILHDYYDAPNFAYATANTENFQDVAEKTSGMQLDFFFDQWIYGEYYPVYSHNWNATPSGDLWVIDLDIEQLQMNQVFEMPIDVTFEYAGGDTTVVVWNDQATQNFILTVNDEPTAVLLDKDEWILRTVEPVLTPPVFDRGILVVNGVDWSVSFYQPDLYDAYADSCFWGEYPITFWDHFPPPSGGYPPNMPAPIGTGPIPADSLKRFSTVVWVGNNYNGDLDTWQDTPILSYLRAGGNVLLMTRYGQSFLAGTLSDYIDVTWLESSTTVENSVSVFSGLVDMDLTGLQSNCAVFDTAMTNIETTLLFVDTLATPEPRGLGAWRKPAGGGTYRPDGGQLVFISGRPYRLNHDQLRHNVEFILGTFFDEDESPVTVAEEQPQFKFRLSQNHPNPFNPHTTIRYSLPAKTQTDLRIYDVAGRLVKTLISGEKNAGVYNAHWDGTDNGGRRVASGVYFYRLTAGPHRSTKKMVLLR